MADYAPPAGPPPPKVPEGWKAVFNDQYKEWFYVNIYTKQSQWEKPTEPIYPEGSGDAPPPGAPPGYDHGSGVNTGPEKGSNNPYYNGSGMSEDERYARQLQEEERSRGSSSGYQQSPYGQAPAAPSYDSNQLPARDDGKKKGLLGKLSSKLGGGSSSRPHYGGGGYPSHGYPPYGGGGYGHPGYGRPPYGGYPPGPGYGPPMHHGGGMYGGHYGQPQRRGGGMGAGGGAALGLGAGLLGGALIADGMDDSYEEGYEDGGGGDMGGDDGGGE